MLIEELAKKERDKVHGTTINKAKPILVDIFRLKKKETMKSEKLVPIAM